MTISPKVKMFFVITAKHLVLAAFTNGAFMVAFPQEFHLHNWRGAEHVLLIGIAQIVGREAIQVWLPAILAWAKEPTQ